MHAPHTAFQPTWAWTPEGLVPSPVVCVDGDGRVVPHRGEPVTALRGLLLPGLINAHTHLELGPIPTERQPGLVDWVRAVRVQGKPSATQAGQGVHQAIRAGTAAVGEISNTDQSAAVLAAAKMPAVCFSEVIGIDVEAPPARPHRLTPHAPYSTHPNLIGAAEALPGVWSIHFDEDPEERVFLQTGGGRWADFLRRVGRDLSRFPTPHCSPAQWLAHLGVLSPRSLLVHATCTRGADLDIVAAAGAPVALCVRSNLHITGLLPDVHGMITRGVPLAVGTDSLASAPDLDLLAEATALRRAFPDVSLTTWLHALTGGGADALGLPLGRLQVGQAPGLLLVNIPPERDPLDALFDGTKWPRKWLACPSF